MYLEGPTSDLYLEKRSDLQHYDITYTHLQVLALDPDSTRHFITDAIKTYINADTPPLSNGDSEQPQGSLRPRARTT